MESLKGRIVCITGASSGIGAACAVEFAKQGAFLLLLARRRQRIDQLATRLRADFSVRTHTLTLDVRSNPEVQSAVRSLPDEWKAIDILVNNAGLSRGLAPLQSGSLQDWEEMIDTNIKGVLYVTREILPGMVERKRGQIVNIGSIAGHAVYPAGNVYCATKFFINALSQGMKMDLLGTGIKVCSVDPGLVQTEFSEVRFRGDRARAAQVYASTKALQPEDVADIVMFCATRAPHVDISDVIVMSTDQASVNHVHRRT
jgi:serine 3-dehydrogenase